MRRTFSRTGVIILLIAVVGPALIFFSPYLTSSTQWIRHRELPYWTCGKITLPFRWVEGDGAVTLKKPNPTLTAFFSAVPLMDTTLSIHTLGTQPIAEDKQTEMRQRLLGTSDPRGILDTRTTPFTSVGLVCSGPGNPKSASMIFVICFSPDYRSSFIFLGDKNLIQEAGDIAKQVIRPPR